MTALPLDIIGFCLALTALVTAIAVAFWCRALTRRRHTSHPAYFSDELTHHELLPLFEDPEYPANGLLSDDPAFVPLDDPLAAEADGPWDDDDFLNGRWSAAGPGVNPATGLPMVGAFDVAGNPYGFDLHTWDHSDDF